MTEIQHKTKETLYDQQIPNLVEMQIKSYEWFKNEGLKELLDSFSPIKNFNDTYQLEFIGDPKFEEPINTEEDCRRDMNTYQSAIKVKVRLSHRDENNVISYPTEENICLAHLPQMTDNGTFIINGAERVVVSQLSRSSGAYFELNFDNSGKPVYSGKILPTVGAWIEMFTEGQEMKAHIATSSKFPITVLLRALNLLPEACPVKIDSLLGKKVVSEILDPEGNVLFYPAPEKPVKKSKSKSKKNEKEVDILTKEHLDKLKEFYPDGYIYIKDYNEISTTIDILETFGVKKYIPISRFFNIENFRINEKGHMEKFTDTIIVPINDRSKPKSVASSRDSQLRVLKNDIYDKEQNLLFKAGLKFDDPKLICKLPKDKVTINKKQLDAEKCIEYLLSIKSGSDKKKKYQEAIEKVDNYECNILLEYLDINSNRDQDRAEVYYNIVGKRPAKNIRIVDNELIYEDYDPENLKILEDGKDDTYLVKAGDIITKADAQKIYSLSPSVYLEYYDVSELISNTIKIENQKQENNKKRIKVYDKHGGLLAFQRCMKPNDPPNEGAAETLLRNYLFDNKRYDVGKVGRYKLNRKLGLSLPNYSTPGHVRSITREDIVKLIKYTVFLEKDGMMVSDYYEDRKGKILETIDEYVTLVKNNKIDGICEIIYTETPEQDGTTKVKTEAKSSKFSKIEGNLLDGRLAMYDRLKQIVVESEKGYLISKEEYKKLQAFLKKIAEDLSNYRKSPKENYDYLTFALSESPSDLNMDYVLMRVNPCITDEIDHLENKRVRSVGELLQDEMRQGFVRLERVAKDRMNLNPESMTVSTLISNKSITSSINHFFGNSQLSQFMDQTNPLAELTHKRRLSALGPGGLSKQSAKIEVRDVHHSHYGRICPIETPEGPNIGLIGSVAIHARINDYGFLETPYRKVREGYITDEIIYLSAEEESHEYIATANIKFDSKTKKILSKNSVVRHNGKYPNVECDKITLMEISPNQIMSVAANLIPFIENDDANRALMGSNMQRQAVPLLKPTAPIVRTGIEGRAAHDSGVEKFAKRDGRVVWVSCENIVVLPEEPTYVDEYEITENIKKTYNSRDALFTCVKRRYAFSDKKKENRLGEETVIAMNSNISRKGESEQIQLDGVSYLKIDPEKESEVKIDLTDVVEVGDLIFDGKVYKGKAKTFKFKGLCDTKGINGKVLNKEIISEDDDDEEEVKKNRLTVKEADLYCLEPTVVRNAFPKGYAIVRFGNIELKSDTGGVGLGQDNHIKLEKKDKKYYLDVVECDDVHLISMVRSNQGTCINSRAVVEMGRRVYKGELLADGPCTDHGELALGQNVTVAFLPWNGYNYEDAVLLNERLVKDDKFSSIHIEKYEIEARDTKVGTEEITRDIPNVSEDSLKDLDERGIIKVGASVKAGSILVGKVAPKGTTDAQPEDKLIKSIFGPKAEEIRDVSLKVPHGENGVVVDVKLLSRYKYHCSNQDCGKAITAPKKIDIDVVKCDRCGAPLVQDKEDDVIPGVNQFVRVYIAQKRKIMKGDKMAGRHGNKGVVSNILQEADMPFMPDGTPVDIVLNPLGVPSRMNIGQILETHQGYAGTHLGLKFKNPIFQSAIEREIIADLEIMTAKKIVDTLLEYCKELEINIQISERKLLKATNDCIERVKEATGKDLETVADPLNDIKAEILEKVLEEIKQYDAFDLEILSRNLCGDKVIDDDSQALSEAIDLVQTFNHKKFKVQSSEDSAYEDGNYVDELDNINKKIKAVKSSYKLTCPKGYDYQKLITNIEKIVIKRVGFHAKLAKTDLYDGISGDKLNQPVAVGTIYMLKLHHLVEDKMHARATGPYSLVTQQPLGGKAQFGGQRFGEMEVWALEAYGAAYTLQEILTIKSDDVLGREATYKAIIDGNAIPNSGIPESFKILVNELQSLCLKITVSDEQGNAVDIRTYDETPIKIK